MERAVYPREFWSGLTLEKLAAGVRQVFRFAVSVPQSSQISGQLLVSCTFIRQAGQYAIQALGLPWVINSEASSFTLRAIKV